MSDISYKNWPEMSDRALLANIGAFIKHHRLQQNKSQAAVSKAAGLSRSTLSLLERGEKINLASLLAVLRVLDLLHIMDVFTFKNEIGPVEYAKLKQKERQRASSNQVNEDREEWTW